MKRYVIVILLVFVSIILSSCELLGQVDNNAPVVEGNSSLVFSINSDVPDWTNLISALDEEDGAIRIEESMVESNVDFTTAGIYEVKFFVVDSDDKTTLFTINVEIVDDRVYTFSILGSIEINHEVNNDFTDPGVLALDLDGNEAIYNVEGSVNSELVGSYTLTYSMDGVDIPIVRKVNVVDTIAPIISLDTISLLLGNYSDQSWLDYIDNVTDNYSESINIEVIESTINYNETGIYTVTVKATDEAGNESTATFSVLLSDIVLLISGDSIIDLEVHTDYTDLGAVALDSNLTQYDLIITYDLDVDVLGSYTIKYTVVGFESISLSRVINVVDTIAPILVVSDKSILKDDSDLDWTTMYDILTDNYDSFVDIIEVEDNVIYGTPGEYTVVLKATDSSDNETTVTFNVIIPDTMITILSELPDEEITITFWHIYGSSKAALLDDLIAQFELLYPNINVVSISQGSYQDLENKIKLSIAAGVSPNLVVGYPDHIASYLNMDSVIPLDDFIESDIWGVDLNDFVTAFVNENKQYEGGYMYSMPYSKSTDIVMFNKDIFAANGLVVPTDRSLTFEELEAYAAVLVGTGENQCEYLINYDSPSNFFINNVRMWDGGYTNIAGDILVNNANTLSMLNTIQGYFNDKTIALPIAWNQNYGSYNFINEDVCMTVGSIAGINYNIPQDGAFEVGIAPIPQWDVNHQSVTQQGPNIAVMSNSTDVQRLASWLLIKYLTSTEATTAWALNTQYLPVRYSAYESAIYQDFLNNPSDEYLYESTGAKAAYLQIDYFAYDPAFAGLYTSSSARSHAGIAMESIFIGTNTVQQAIDEMLEQLGVE